MEQITVTHPDGTTLDLNSFSAPSAISSATLKCEFQGTDSIEIKVKSASPLDFYIGDSITYLGAKYTINQTPKIQKKAERDLEYTLTFEGLQYELIDRVFLLSDIEDTPRTSLTGTLKDFMNEVVANASRESDYTWSYNIQSVGVGEDEAKTETFEENNCLEVLQQLMEDFECEFRIVANENSKTRVINIAEDGALAEESLAGYVFEYGQAGGAYELKREPADNTNIITRLFVYGSSDNINTAENGESKMYRNTRLCLPEKNKATSYIQDQELIGLFGLKEGIMTLDDIKPQCKGVVQSVTNENGATTFKAYKYASIAGYGEEYDIDFDINGYLMPDTDASIIFQTGELAGYEFDLNGTDNFVDNGDNTITIKINPFYDENGMRFPYDGSSEAFNIRAGNEFNFNNIYFPLSRIESAEVELKDEAQKQFDETSIPQIKYSLTIDPIWLMNREDPQRTGVLSDPFTVGNTVHVKDTALDLDDSIRINSLTRDLLQDWKFTLTLADKTTPNLVTKIINSMHIQDEIIKINDLTNSAKARRNWMTMQQVYNMVFDTEGNYYSEKIAPLSIETTMLSVGARSQQFTLQGILFEVNYNKDCNSVYNCAGTLEHFTIDDNYIITWNIAQRTQSGLDSGTAYYVYARCPKNYDSSGGVNDGGEIFYSATSYTFEGKNADGETLDADNYYFLIGTLTTAYTDTGNDQYPSRDLALTYGSTTINGRFIRTGRIQADTGNTYFDLDTGEICGTIRFTQNGSTAEELINEVTDKATALSYLEDTFPQSTTTISGGVVLTSFVGIEGSYNSYATSKILSVPKSSTYSNLFYPGNLHDTEATIASFTADSGKGTLDVPSTTIEASVTVTGTSTSPRTLCLIYCYLILQVGSTEYTLGYGVCGAQISGQTDFSTTITTDAGTYNVSSNATIAVILRVTCQTDSGSGGQYSVYSNSFSITYNYTASGGAGAVAGLGAVSSENEVMLYAGANGYEERANGKFTVTRGGDVKMTSVELNSANGDASIDLRDGNLTLQNTSKSLFISPSTYGTLSDAGLAKTQAQTGTFKFSGGSGTYSAKSGSCTRNYASSNSVSFSVGGSYSENISTGFSGNVELTIPSLGFGGRPELTITAYSCSGAYPGIVSISYSTTLNVSCGEISSYTSSSNNTSVTLNSSTASSTLSIGSTLSCSSQTKSVALKENINYHVSWTISVTITLDNPTVTGQTSSWATGIRYSTTDASYSVSGGTCSWSWSNSSSSLVSRLFSNGLIFQGDSTAQQFGVMPTADLGFIASNGNGCAIEVNQASGSDYYFSQPSGISATGTGTGLWNNRGIFANNDIANNAYGRGWVDLMPGILLVLRWNSPSAGATASNFAQWSPYKCFINTVARSSAGDYELGMCYSGSSVYPLVSVYSDRVTISTWHSGTTIYIQIKNSSGTLTDPTSLCLVVFRSNLTAISY